MFVNPLERAHGAPTTVERGLTDGRRFLAGDAYTVADIALYGYVHCGADVGANPREHRHIAAWLSRVQATPGFVNDLEPAARPRSAAADLTGRAQRSLWSHSITVSSEVRSRLNSKSVVVRVDDVAAASRQLP